MTRVEILNGETIKSGDDYPALRAKLYDREDPFNLTGYDVTVTIRRTDSDSPVVSSQTATVESATRGIVEYDWNSSETSDSGTYLVEFVADDGNNIVSFPNDTYARIYIEDRL